MATLANYLANLNTSENQWSLWVNPKDLDEYRIGQNCFEAGGVTDGKVCIGSLDSLSFGYQNTAEAIKQYVEDCKGVIQYGDRTVRLNAAGISEAYSNGNLDDDFREFLEDEAESIKAIWAEHEASSKVEDLGIYFAPGGKWEQECAQAEMEEQAWQSELDRQKQEFEAEYAQ